MATLGIIYAAVNTVNDKQYIGQTRMPKLSMRISKHKYSAAHPSNKGCRYFDRAMAKHGFSAFNWRVICQVAFDELDRCEAAAIRDNNTLAPNGYNLRPGGMEPGLWSLHRSKRQRKCAKDNCLPTGVCRITQGGTEGYKGCFVRNGIVQTRHFLSKKVSMQNKLQMATEWATAVRQGRAAPPKLARSKNSKNISGSNIKSCLV